MSKCSVRGEACRSSAVPKSSVRKSEASKRSSFGKRNFEVLVEQPLDEGGSIHCLSPSCARANLSSRPSSSPLGYQAALQAQLSERASLAPSPGSRSGAQQWSNVQSMYASAAALRGAKSGDGREVGDARGPYSPGVHRARPSAMARASETARASEMARPSATVRSPVTPPPPKRPTLVSNNL